MKLRLAPALLFSVICLLSSRLAAGTLVSGPMLGYQAHREVFLWVETKDAQQVTLDYWIAGRPETKKTLEHTNPAATPAGGQITTFRPGLLETGATYDYTLSIDGVAQQTAAPAKFRTHPLWEWRTPPPDFKFITGSCAYINEPVYDRPGEPYGRTVNTFKLMGDSGADFMVWLGDNWYWREADFDSVSGLWHRPSHDRAIPEMQKLLGAMHHYAVWDDHDFGPNDSNWSYEYKAEALKIFQAYWGNHSYGEPENPGVYSKFYWGDAAFFLMDNHYHRDAAGLDQDKHPEKSQWGRHQLEWLKQSLLQAKALKHFTFKFIATGNQMLQTEPRGEPHELYRREREELMDFIRENQITGVVFLTGDVHHSALYRRQLPGNGQWVYEITSSPLSSSSWEVEKSDKAKDPYVIPGTLVGDQNFVSVAVTGQGADRALTLTCTDKQGATRFTHTVKATDLGYVPPRRRAP
ncbi:MAG TPA: alkaline phosphatase D family protein [Lacunisphaera sp.]|nr:alkaline phosphatase D family protein [Lacunisphaera sp.]